jgi:hypothetical protein
LQSWVDAPHQLAGQLAPMACGEFALKFESRDPIFQNDKIEINMF